MLPRLKVLLAAALALALVGLFWGCNRLTNKVNENQAPVVSFVNVPLDSSVFNYAPVVRWTGYDPDGLVTEYHYYDDTTQAGQDAYYATAANSNALTEYASHIADSLWTRTFANQDTIYLRRGEHDVVTQHTFLLRCIDNLGAASLVKARHFSRTNRPPNTPKVKWLLDSQQDRVREYLPTYDIPDTLFWGDSLTLTWPGVAFNWIASDSDGTVLNPIPLTFSWSLVNLTSGDTIPYSSVDSAGVTHCGTTWSPWSSSKQIVFYGKYVQRCNANIPMDGQYKFFLRVRDDGLTTSDTMAVATFTAIHALWDDPNPAMGRQLLIVDWNKHAANATEQSQGLDNDARIDSFYKATIPQAFDLAERIRQVYYDFPGPMYIPPIVADTAWFLDKDLNAARRIPYDYIRHFKWIWVIDDNPPGSPPNSDVNIWGRLKVMQDYMDVGGEMMLSGRRVFQGNFNLNQPKITLSSSIRDHIQYFLHSHFNISVIYPGLPNTAADFMGTTTTDQYLPALNCDSVLVHNLRFRTSRYWNLPEIDYLGRSAGTTGYDYTISPYTYQSSTQNDSLLATNIDCGVISSTPRLAYLRPAPGDDRILAVTRVYNASKHVMGEFIRTDIWHGDWRIIVSTPEDSGAWVDSDTLEVDYKFLHVSESHDQPLSVVNAKIESIFDYDLRAGTFSYTLWTRYRSTLLCVPLSFMDSTPVDVRYLPGIQASPAAIVIATQILSFNSPRINAYGNRQ
jgi:hypothetical protein